MLYMDKLDISIQVVNYNTKKYLEVCLDGMVKDLEGEVIQWEALVLDNASADDLTELGKKYGQLPVRFLHSEKNLGFGGGHNKIAKEARGEYILLLNPDIEFVESKTIRRLLEEARKKGVAVIGPRLITKESVTQAWDHGELKGLKAWVENNKGDSYWKERATPGIVAWVSGAAFLIRKDIFEEIGGFDENFFLYKEEEELSLRLRQKGYASWYEPSIIMRHIGSVVAKKDDHMGASKAYYIKKHFKRRPVYYVARLLAALKIG